MPAIRTFIHSTYTVTREADDRGIYPYNNDLISLAEILIDSISSYLRQLVFPAFTTNTLFAILRMNKLVHKVVCRLPALSYVTYITSFFTRRR